MFGRYFTTKSRRITSSDIINSIDNYYSDVDNLKKRAASTLSNLYDENYTDTRYRTVCLESAYQIYSAYSEGYPLAGMDINYDNPASRWCYINSYNLKSYTYGVDKIKDLNNTEYTNYIEDLDGIWKMFKTYSTDRNELMRATDGVYDDNFCRVRNIQITTYTSVMEDADLEEHGWVSKSYSLSKKYKRVVEDVETKVTSPEPILPTVDNFRNLVHFTDSNKNSAKRCLQTIKNTSLTPAPDEDWFRWVTTKNSDKSVIKFTVKDGSSTEAFADTVMSKLKNNILLQSSDKKSYIYLEVIGKKKLITESIGVKDKIKPNYDGTTSDIKLEVFDRHKDIYYRNRYAVEIEALILSKYVEGDPVMTLTNNAESSAICKIIKGLVDKAISSFNSSYYNYQQAPEVSRSDDYNPESFYTDILNKLRNSNCETLDGCKMVQSYCNNALTWIDNRCKALVEQTNDDDNSNRLINALSKRLDKNTGTIIMWYQNLLSIDREFKNIERSRKFTLYSAKRMLVGKALNTNDSTLYNNQLFPRYIDIEQIDNIYDEYRYSFKKGDKIYILDDIHPELCVSITNVSKIQYSTTDYNNADIETISSGNMKSLSKTVNAIRLEINRPLPIYYCNGNDVSSLRVVKLIV